MKINSLKLRDKIVACMLGKSIGGTLGMPFEWKRQLNRNEFYIQNLNGEPIPNDDLDLQLISLIALEERGVDVNCRTLGDYFNIYITPHWAEYGVAKSNMKLGLPPPLSGLTNNVHRHSCGSYIRSEIWACISAGHPERAVRYMVEDSCVDHGCRTEGTYAAVFCAAVEAAAFCESNVETLVGIGLSYIPAECFVRRTVELVLRCKREGRTFLEARDEVLRLSRGMPFYYYTEREQVILCEEEDRKKGFERGKMGFDAPANIGMLTIGLVYGEGDFSRSIVCANTCGEDTDCTAGTVASILGIIGGTSAIPEKWVEPIGTKIKTMSLNFGELDGIDGLIPKDIFELTDRILAVRERVCARFGGGLTVTDGEPEPTGEETAASPRDELACSRHFFDTFCRDFDKLVYSFDFFDVLVDVGDAFIRNGVPKRIWVEVRNRYKVGENVRLRWFLEEGFTVDDNDIIFYVSKNNYGDGEIAADFVFACDNAKSKNELVLQVSVEGKSERLLVPVLLLKAQGRERE